MKKYSDKFLNQSIKLKFARIGFEFEFYMKDISYYKTLELLNIELAPVKVWGFRQYHSDFRPDEKNFKIEPDLSGGSNMVELVTGPLDYYDAKYYLVKIIKFIQTYGYTNEKSSVHFNLSFNNEEKNLNDLNILKLILNTDEDEIYRIFPSRKNNVYAKSIKKIIPYKEYDFFNIPISVVKNNLRLPTDKYYGINFLNIPESYYEGLKGTIYQKLDNDKLDSIKKLNILVDEDKEGYLMQVFSKPLQNRPTFFIEVIQRQNSKGFGSGNIKALYEAVQKNQQVQEIGVING